MPIFMDRHMVGGATAAEVAEAHQKDLKIQDKYGCTAMTYWFDEKSGLAFCLIEAPKMEAVVEMHNEAHGLVPNKVIPVDENLVYSFLGRISDPSGKNRKMTTVINETGLRTLLHLETKYPYGYFKILKQSGEYSKTLSLNNPFIKVIKKEGGSIVSEDSSGILASFINQDEAVKCAQNIQVYIKQRRLPIKVSIGLSNGLPVSEDREVFGDTVKTAKNLSYTAMPGKIFLSHSIKHLQENLLKLSTVKGIIKTLKQEEESFLNNLISYAETNLDTYDAGLEHCCEYLGMSKSNLYRKTISLTSFSPGEFLKEFRLKTALKKLINHEGNIAEIAFASGFNTPSYFTQCFKERYGILPSDHVINVS